MIIFRKMLVIWFGLAAFAAHAQTAEFPFRNETLPTNARINDLISRLSVQEKISLLHTNFEGVARLDIPKYYHGNEGLHGVMGPGKFTVFPQAIGLAACWNPELLYKVATAIGDEARGRWNELEQGKLQKEHFLDLLTLWSPDLNLARDPRWGRTPETYGEDPFLASELGVAFVKGLQGNDPKYLKVVSTPKHYTANNEEHNRFECNAVMSERDLREYHLAPFEAAIKRGKAEAIMSAYNAVNGIPCSASKLLLTDILRKEWGFNGYVVSDCGAPVFLTTRHKYVPDQTAASVAAMNAGLDLECGFGCDDCNVYPDHLHEAFQKGLVKEAQIDSAAYRVLRAYFKLGMFDKFESVAYNKIPPSVVGCPEHQQLALETARQSIVLLKNDAKTLPINPKKVKTIAVTGPCAETYEYGDYSGVPLNNPVNVADGIRNMAGNNFDVKVVSWTTRDNGFELIPTEYLSTNSGSQKGLEVEYFANNQLEGIVRKRVEGILNFDPENRPPDATIPKAPRSARWTTVLTPALSGEYVLAVTADDGARLFVNGKLLVERWEYRDNLTDEVKINLEKGKKYAVVVEYFDNGGGAVCQLAWKAPDNENGLFADEKAVVAKADLHIAVLGIGRGIEREGLDKTDLELPAIQKKYIEEIYKMNPNTVVVLVAGSPLTINWINENIPAIVNAWYPGEQGGNAVAEVLFGKYNPAGRLPLTYYNRTEDLPPFDDYDQTKGRTYMYLQKKPLYAFGHGLSYTTFKYSSLKLETMEVGKSDSIQMSVTVKNTGKMAGDEVVQVYAHQQQSDIKLPQKQLVAFQRVHLMAGEAKSIELTFPSNLLRYWDETNHCWKIDSGKTDLMVGGASDNTQLKSGFKIMEQPYLGRLKID